MCLPRRGPLRGGHTARCGFAAFRRREVDGTGGKDNPQVGPATVNFVGEDGLCRVPSTMTLDAHIWITFSIVLRATPRG